MIDGHKVDAQATPIGMAHKLDEVDAAWVSKHVQQSRYSLQIVKCLRSECCSQFQTNWLEVFPKKFLPTLAVMEYTIRSKCAVEPVITTKNPKQYPFAPLQDRLIHPFIPASAEQFEIVPFDFYCVSVQTKIKKGICPKCNSYWPSQAAMKRHMKSNAKIIKGATDVQGSTATVDSESEEEEEEPAITCEGDKMPVFDNTFDIFKSPFTEDVENS